MSVDRKVLVDRYFPTVLVNAKEFISIAEAENPEYKLLYELATRWFQNGFVLDLHEDGAERWERMLGLVINTGDTLEDRRRRILARIRSMLPYTHRRLEEILAANFGEGMSTLKFNYNKYLLTVDIDRAIVLQREALFYLLRAIVPANLSITVSYTKRAEEKLYFGAVVGRRQRMKVFTATQLQLIDAAADVYFAAIAGQRKRLKVEAVL